MSPNRDEDTGQFTQEFPRSEFLEAVQSADPATTMAIAEAVGCSYDLAYRRLNALAEEDSLERIEVGGSFVWQVDD